MSKDGLITGLIPAGGLAERLAPLPCSKAILPVGLVDDPDRGKYLKPVARYLLDGMQRAAVDTAYFILSPGKWDIPAYFGNGESVGVELAYLVRDLPFGVPFTLDSAFPFVENARIAFGFPDVIFRPDDAFVRLLARLDESGADIVLGVFPVEEPEKWDAVVFDGQNGIERIVPKPHSRKTNHTWIMAVWTPVFTRFMHEFVSEFMRSVDDVPAENEGEVSLGHVVQVGLNRGLDVDHVTFDEGFCLDVGTPEGLQEAWRLALSAS